MPRRALLALAVLLGFTTVSYGQGIPVYDNTNFLQNIVTAAQSTITAVESVAQTAQGVLNLTPLDEVAVAGEFTETLSLLGGIVSEAEGLTYDVESIQAQVDALFDPSAAPDNPMDLTLRVIEMQQQLFLARRYATKVQTLLSTMQSALTHLANLAGLVGTLLGNMQGQQVMVQMQALTNQQLATQTALHAAHQRAEVMEKMQRDLIRVSLANIEASRWATWPGQ